jgi:2-C-methyl-D-erythritol 4-phosphate cytidylyltransferase
MERETQKPMPKIFALVLAAGQGTRIGDAVPKHYIPVAGKPMMFHSIETLASVPRVDRVLVVLAPMDRHWGAHDWSALPEKVEAAFCGGSRRAESVANTLKHIAERVTKDDWILVHDAARPCIQKELVEQFLDEIGDDAVGGLLAIPLADTLKSADENIRVAATIPRLALWRAQTPQMFRHELLRRGLEKKPLSTDESEAVESLGYYAPRLVQGEDTNIKVTFAEDLQIAEMILKLHGRVEM